MRRLLPGDNPQAYVPGDRRAALAHGEDLPRHTTGSALFVDISGFTSLTEALATELGARRGAEELTATLDRVFAALLERLHVWRGSVIYFSGDAVTAWLDGDDGLGAVACALEMQRVMADVGLVCTPGGREVRLGVKIAVATGSVHRFVVGDPDVQLIDVLAGRLTDSLASAEQVSESGDVVVDRGAMTSLADRVVIAEMRAGEHGPVGVVGGLAVAATDPGAVPAPPVLPDDLVRSWVLPPVWDRMAAGRGEFLAELRPAVPVFLRFGGLDFEVDDTAPDRLDRFVRRTQRVFATHGGYVLQLTIGDKGAYLYAVFGAPVAHEDDAVRACSAALDLIADEEPLTVIDLQVGIAGGRLRSGTYGHQQRRTFCCLGDAVNLAARLMSRAPAGEVWVHGGVADATAGRFAWDALEPVTVKGKASAVPVRVLRGRTTRSAGTPAPRSQREPIVGRGTELGLLRSLAAAAAAGEGHTVVVRAEAGTGKSRLVAELLEGLHRQEVTVAAGEATPVAGVSGYTAWRDVWRSLFGIAGEGAGLRDVSRAVAALDAGLVARAPLLGPLLGLALPDSGLTASFDGELRKTSLEDLLARLIRIRAARGPLVVVIEDAHWLDPLSRDLLGVVARATSSAAVLLVVTSRPDGTAHAGLPVTSARRVTDLALDALDPGAARDLAAARHRAVTGEEPSSTRLDLVVGRCEGNPFYLEQLVDHLAATGSDRSPEAEDQELPPSLHSLVLSRIDAQDEGPRRAMKVASIVGRTFRSALVAGAYPDLGDDDEVDGHLRAVAANRLVALEDPVERRFAFGHAVTRDVAYDSLPYGIRTVLHGRIGDALEREPDGPRRHLDLLVHHYTRSEDIAQQRRYLLAAAEAARATYAVAAALDHLQQVLPLVEPDERPDVLLQLADAWEIDGDWTQAEDAAGRALEAAIEVGDRRSEGLAKVTHAELHRKQGRYADARAALDRAAMDFVEVDDAAGTARVLHLRGTLASQQGDPAAARAAYQASLDVRRGLGDEAGVAAMLTNLALVAEDEGDLELAERIGIDALARRRALGDRRAESVSLTNMGMLASARGELGLAMSRFEEAQRLAEEVGDPWVVAVGHHNLGNAARDLGRLEEVAEHLRAALEAYAEHDDRWSLAHLFEDVAVWCLVRGRQHDSESARLLGAAQRVREEIGAPRFPPTEAALAQALTPAVSAGRATRRPATAETGTLDGATADGHRMALEEAVALAADLVGTGTNGAFGH